MRKYLVQWHSTASHQYGLHAVEAKDYKAAVKAAQKHFTKGIAIIGCVCLQIPLTAQSEIVQTVINHFTPGLTHE